MCIRDRSSLHLLPHPPFLQSHSQFLLLYNHFSDHLAAINQSEPPFTIRRAQCRARHTLNATVQHSTSYTSAYYKLYPYAQIKYDTIKHLLKARILMYYVSDDKADRLTSTQQINLNSIASIQTQNVSFSGCGFVVIRRRRSSRPSRLVSPISCSCRRRCIR